MWIQTKVLLFGYRVKNKTFKREDENVGVKIVRRKGANETS